MNRSEMFGMAARPLSVLIVEDHDDARVSTVELLELEGYDVRAAASCREARSVVAAYLPDVALIDLGLPDGSGYDLARELAMLPGRPPAVVVVSGRPVDPGRAAEAGVVVHYAKPVAPATVRKLLRTYALTFAGGR
jgi:CheY-like chemotaxis protein